MPFLHKILVQWDMVPDPATARWEIFASKGKTLPEDRNDPGECVGHACASERKAEIELAEGEYVVQVLPRSLGGALPGNWQKQTFARLLVGIPNRPVAALRNPVVAVADLRLAGLVAADPRQFGDDAHAIEIIEGPSPEKGTVIARVDAPSLDSADTERGVRAAMTPFPLSGHGTAAERTLHVRALSEDGRPGAATPFTSLRPLPPDFEAVTIASIVGTTRTNFPAPASTAAYELDGTDGVRLKAIPLSKDATAANWGALSATLLNQPGYAKFLVAATLTSDEVDLGHKLLFVLDCSAAQQRKSDTIPSIPSRQCHWPSRPQEHPGLRNSAPSPAWNVREIMSNGKPKSPLPPPYWEVAYGDAPGPSVYVPVVPGMWIAARYVKVRVTFREPTGLFQVIAPSLYARALVARRTVAGTGVVDGGVATETVTLATDPITGVSPFQNQFVVVVTSRTSDHAVYVTTKTPATPSFVVTHRTVEATPATPGTDTDFDYIVTGY